MFARDRESSRFFVGAGNRAQIDGRFFPRNRPLCRNRIHTGLPIRRSTRTASGGGVAGLEELLGRMGERSTASTAALSGGGNGRRRTLLRAAISIALLTAVAVLLSQQVDRATIGQTVHDVSFTALGLAATALLAGALLAAARVRLVADDLGYRLTWREALAALGLGQIGGAAFFQIAGQLIARGAYLSRRGLPVEATVVMVGYERLLAFGVSVFLAGAGAWHIFGRIAFDLAQGGDVFVKLIAGLALTVAAGAWLGWGRTALDAIAARREAAGRHAPDRPVRSGSLTGRVGRSLLLSVAIQLMTASAYVLLAGSLAPGVSTLDLLAASVVVMLAASLPVSLAGWGVRELSAVLALGAVGVPPAAAFLAAILIGIGSLLVVAPMAALALTGRQPDRQGSRRPSADDVNYGLLIALAGPLAVAATVFFHVHLPTEAGGLNVTLSDPLAVLCGALLAVRLVQRRSWPEWRLSGLSIHAGLATAALCLSLLLGAYRFGWTDWALINKFLGWFVLLAYAATGALIVSAAGQRGMRIFLCAFAAAGAAVAILEFALIAAAGAGASLSRELLETDAVGFARNRNAFAFQMLMVAAVAAALARTRQLLSIALGAVALAALWYAASRAGWIAGAVLLLLGVSIRALSLRQIVLMLAGAAGIVLAIAVFAEGASWMLGLDPAHRLHGRLPSAIPNESTVAERMQSLVGGFALFREYPIFGAGLGAYIEGEIRNTGIPLVIHATPLWLLAETGLVGFLVFLIPVLRLLRLELLRPEKDEPAKLLVLALFAFGVMALAHEMLYQRTLWLLLGAALAAVPVSRQDSAAQTRDPTRNPARK